MSGVEIVVEGVIKETGPAGVSSSSMAGEENEDPEKPVLPSILEPLPSEAGSPEPSLMSALGKSQQNLPGNQSSSPTVPKLSAADSDDFIYMISDEEFPELESEEEKEAYDATGKTDYKNACKRLGVVPATYFLRHIQDEDILMGYYGLGPRGGRAMASVLGANTKVVRLDLKHNGLEEDGAMALCSMMEENCFISYLNLSHNRMGHIGSMAVEKMLQNNSTLIELNCAGNMFDEHCAKPWASAMNASLRLRKLDLSFNQFGEQGGQALAPAIAENESIQELSLRWNHLRMDGAMAIAWSLKTNQMLKVLDLAWNGFANEGAGAVGESLKSNSTLQVLDLSHNRITEEGAKMLAKGIAVNESLKVLKLGDNPLQMGGVTAIFLAMKSNPNNIIEELYFDNITITLELQQVMDEMSGQRPGLRVTHGGLGGVEARAESEKQKDPMVLVKQYIDRANLRLIDFFNSIDKDKSMSVTVEEFEVGLARAKVALTKDQIRDLVIRLDKDGDGEIDYGEFVYGAQQVTAAEREHKKKNIAALKYRKDEEARKSQIIMPPES